MWLQHDLQQEINPGSQCLFFCSALGQGLWPSSSCMSSVLALQLGGGFPTSYWCCEFGTCMWVVWIDHCRSSQVTRDGMDLWDVAQHTYKGEEPHAPQTRPWAIWDRFGVLLRSSHTSRHMNNSPSAPCASKVSFKNTFPHGLNNSFTSQVVEVSPVLVYFAMHSAGDFNLSPLLLNTSLASKQ